MVVASKRGRSHANVGSFRDDDFAFKDFENTGWSVICAADGAGSAKLSREGSKIAVTELLNFFSENLK
ncbi:MAG: protein phosphatase 2C domain-containing protein [Flavobacterium sp.]|nr:protein phosphatase 2C domain-containing protein [Flavobacterium sp.]